MPTTSDTEPKSPVKETGSEQEKTPPRQISFDDPRLKGLLSRLAGLSLHYFGGVGTHDATNNFKLYQARFLDEVDIESNGGFELALELTVKATLMGRRVAEVPAVWRDRETGESNFKLRAWLPSYLHWYVALFRGRIGGLFRRDSRAGDST